MNLAVTVAATANYCYSMKTLGRRVAANLSAAGYTGSGTAIIAGDNSRQVKDAVKAWKDALPDHWAVIHLDVAEENKDDVNYKANAQMLIARLRGAAFSEARNCSRRYSADVGTHGSSRRAAVFSHMLRPWNSG